MIKNVFMYIIVIAVVAVGVWLLVKKGNNVQTGDLYASPTPTVAGSASVTPAPTVVTLPGGLQIQDEVIGVGAEAKAGDTVSVQYTGWLTNGQKFDSSFDHGQPFTFQLGMGQVIRGWDEGVAGMKVGGKRHLVIPSDLAYGARGAGNVIPPNAILVFEVELLSASRTK